MSLPEPGAAEFVWAVGGLWQCHHSPWVFQQSGLAVPAPVPPREALSPEEGAWWGWPAAQHRAGWARAAGRAGGLQQARQNPSWRGWVSTR